jgi:hypothetical protein
MNNRSDETLLLGSVEEIVVRVGKPKRRSAKSQEIAAPTETLSVDSQLHDFTARAIPVKQRRTNSTTPKKRRKVDGRAKERAKANRQS